MTPISVFDPQAQGINPITPVLITAPSIEPVSLNEAKAWLRLDNTDEDSMITALITAARLTVEAASRRLLISQNWRLVMDHWPVGGIVKVQLSPFKTILAARSFDINGNATTYDPTGFIVDKASEPARIMAANNIAPVTGRPFAGIELDVQLGFGANASDVPQPLRQAILLLVALWFENRGDGIGGAGEPLPPAIKALITPFKRPRIGG
jgi:uncharacterized phiE125 gp8 family phage protein